MQTLFLKQAYTFKFNKINYFRKKNLHLTNYVFTKYNSES